MRKLPVWLSVFVVIIVSSVAAQTPELSGVVFGDYLYVANHADTVVDGLSALSIRRVYFTVDKKFNEKYFLRFRLEISDALGEPIRYRVETSGARTSERLEPFVKHLYLTIKNAVPNSQMSLGLSGTPTFSGIEEFWGLRSVEKVIMDLNGNASTVDLGIGLAGNFRSGGKLRYHVMAGTGSGTRNESDNSKRLYSNLSFTSSSGIFIQPYVDYQFKDGEIEDRILAQPTPSRATGQLSTLSLFAGIKRPKFRLAGQVFQQTSTLLQNLVLPASQTDITRRGFSAFGVLQPKKSLGLFARFDNYDPNTDLDNDGYNLIIAGLDLAPHESIHFLPNLWLQNFEADGRESTTVLRLSFEFKY
jgi:hypothetical protein